MRTQHTPGPWNYDGEYTILHNYADGDVGSVSTVHWTGDNSEVKANARLIAAAPELLQSLVESLAAMERMDALLLKFTGSPKECEKGEIARARAAIANAVRGA